MRHIMRDKETPKSTRLAAAIAIIDRGYGRPAQSFEGKVTTQTIDPTQVSDAELLAFIAQAGVGAGKAGTSVEPAPQPKPKLDPTLN